MCYETFVLICHHGGTGLIKILGPKQSKKPKKNCLLIVFFILTIGSECVMCYHLHLFKIMYSYGISFIAFYG